MKIAAKTKCDLTTDALMEMIARGDYKAGDRLPTEKELTEMVSVSRVTIREAIKHSDGVIWMDCPALFIHFTWDTASCV